jgi:hypothetical protein
MVQNNRRVECPRTFSHVPAPAATFTWWGFGSPSPPGAEHNQVIAAKNKDAFIGETQKVRVKVNHLHERSFFVAHGVGLPGPRYLSSRHLTYSHELSILRVVIIIQVDPDREDFNLSLRGSQHAVGHSSQKYRLSMHSQRTKVGPFGIPAHAAVPFCREGSDDETAWSNQELQTPAFGPLVPQDVEEQLLTLDRIAGPSSTNHHATDACHRMGNDIERHHFQTSFSLAAFS